ncbi:velvet factor-domain-containing protein [Mycena sanguinolenta]|nr:velvet factor-domain-containing protein [Mycena sanguinolenta]
MTQGAAIVHAVVRLLHLNGSRAHLLIKDMNPLHVPERSAVGAMSYPTLHDYDFESMFSSRTDPAILQSAQECGHAELLAESRIHPVGASIPGNSIYFSEGRFAGRTVRATLEELQKPVFGRKTVSTSREAKVDRRPLDPAPVACLSLFEIFDNCTTQIDYDSENTDLSGLMCSVELFSIRQSMASSPSAPDGSGASTPPSSAASPYKATSELVGTTVVQAATIPWKGKTCVLFPFVDLSVKKEGYFVLQYRFFDLFSVPADQANPIIQAECWGTPFRVYSTKETPPLEMSTELSKVLARHGIRLNVRETTRKRKNNSRDETRLFTTQLLRSQDVLENDSDDERT